MKLEHGDSIESILSLEFDFPERTLLTAELFAELEEEIAETVTACFANEFSLDANDLSFKISVRRGSLLLEVSATVATIWLILSKYDSVRKGAISFAADIRSVWAAASQKIQSLVRRRSALANVDLEKQRSSLLEQLDSLMLERQLNNIPENEFINQGVNILARIEAQTGKSVLSTPYAAYAERQHQEAQQFLMDLEVAYRHKKLATAEEQAERRKTSGRRRIRRDDDLDAGMMVTT